MELNRAELAELGLDYTPQQVTRMQNLANAENTQDLGAIGRCAAERDLDSAAPPEVLDLGEVWWSLRPFRSRDSLPIELR